MTTEKGKTMSTTESTDASALAEVERRLRESDGYAPEDRIRMALLHIDAHREGKARVTTPTEARTDEDRRSWAVAFMLDLIVMLEEQADNVEHPTDGVSHIEVAIDRDGFAEWGIAALAEIGLLAADQRHPQPETVEWEYGATHVDDDKPVTVKDTLAEADAAREFYTSLRGRETTVLRRTKAIPAGPWLPVSPEGGETK